jgi:hypothetical protein
MIEIRTLEIAKKRIGEIFYHPKYGEYSIIAYTNCEEVKIRFKNTGYEYITSYNHIQNLEVRDRFFKGKYDNYVGVGDVDRDAYRTWYNMIHRCNNQKGYKDVSICDEWSDFSNFLKWYNNQYKEDGWHLDKDILSNNGRVYSPQTCCFLPPDLNTFFEKFKKAKGFSYSKRYKKYESYCRDRGKYVHLGLFQTAAEARIAYLDYKRNLLEELVKPYLNKISVELYNAMKRYLW